MTIDSMSGGIAAAQGQKGASQTARASLDTDYQSFLTLLTAQIQNQDPLEPMDSTTFVSQLAQLSQVEQAITTNSNLEDISSNLSGLTGLSAAGMIGREVRVSASDFALPEEGGAELSFKLDRDASRVSAAILHPDGTVLKRIDTLPTSAGAEHQIAWDGVAMDGLPVPAGSYRLDITAEDNEGAAVSHESFTSAAVASVTFANGETRLQLSTGQDVSPDAVLELR